MPNASKRRSRAPVTMHVSTSPNGTRGQWDAECDLHEKIRRRIVQRLGDRVRDLSVRIEDDRIILEGRCATYYSKQLAQHAALGVIEDEHLENAIQVGILQARIPHSGSGPSSSS